MKNKFILAALLVSSSAAFAGPGYVGVSAGSSTQKLGADDFSLSESATAFKIVGGYQATPMFGLEAGYVRFGEASISADGASIGSEPTSFYAALTGTVPVSPAFNLFAKLGVAKSKTTIFASDVDGRDEFEESGTSAVVGIGAQYKFSDTMSLVAEYENFGKVAKDSESSANVKVSLVSVGLRIAF